MGQEWRLYDVGGARNTVRLLYKHLYPSKKTNLLTPGIREQHGTPSLMMVGTKDTAPNSKLINYTVDAIIFLA